VAFSNPIILDSISTSIPCFISFPHESLARQFKRVDVFNLPLTWAGPVHIAVIGGTGLYHMEGYTPVARVNLTTPWGPPSAPILILEDSGVPVAFLARHGVHHELAPHEVPSRANMAALRRLGVRCVIAFSAVGSLQEHVRPTDFVVPDQIIDRTKGLRPSTFFEGGLVGHVGFADPFDRRLAELVKQCAASLEGQAITVHGEGTLVCMGTCGLILQWGLAYYVPSATDRNRGPPVLNARRVEPIPVVGLHGHQHVSTARS
jgi:hypothetical protein